MSDPNYQPPKTDPRSEEVYFVKNPRSKISTRKILFLTFFPSLFLFLGTMMSEVDFDLFVIIAFLAAILAFSFSIYTTVVMARGKEPLYYFGYWLLLVVIHAILLFVTFFVGCGIAMSSAF